MARNFSPSGDSLRTRRQVADFLGYASLRSVTRLEEKGLIKKVNFTGHPRYRFSDVKALVAPAATPRKGGAA